MARTALKDLSHDEFRELIAKNAIGDIAENLERFEQAVCDGMSEYEAYVSLARIWTKLR